MNISTPNNLKTVDRTGAGQGMGRLSRARNAALPPPTGNSFADALNQKVNSPSSAADQAHQKAEDAAAGLVSNALILPILKQLRRSSESQNTIFSGGMGEKTFGPEFDMQLSDRIAHSPRLPIREALAARLEKRSAARSGTTIPGASANPATPSKTARLDVNG